MKNLNKIIKNILILTWVGLSCSILKAEVVITELFILPEYSTHTPQYIELYNNSDTTVNLLNWSITTLDGDDNEFAGSPYFNNNSGLVDLNEDRILYNEFDEIEGIEIDPRGYFLISSDLQVTTWGSYFYNEKNESDIIAFFLYLPLDGIGKVILSDDNESVIDSVKYNIDDYWPDSEKDRGRSLRLHVDVAPNSVDNDSLKNWSLSPKTERSILLYDEDEDEEIKSFGSPREENSFRLKGYEDFTHFIFGDINNIYNADNNYGDSIKFDWYGTFDIDSVQQYKLIIEKTGTEIPEKHGFEIISYPEKDTTLIWENIIGIDTSIIPQSLLIDSTGLEFANFSWTVELTKGSDTIYSDRHRFSIDASDYGYYGCIDNNSCKIESEYPTCPTTADDETLFSNHPIECIPGVDCYSAINLDTLANINSNICHYVSLSIPAFVIGYTKTIASVPIYFNNDSSANINSIAYTLSFDGASPGILSYDTTRFSGTVIAPDEYVVDDQYGKISVNIPISSEEDSLSGIITYIDFILGDSLGALTNLSLTEVGVTGGTPKNIDISVPVKDGEIVTLQTDYEIAGQVYYSLSDGGEPFEVPDVEIKLNKKYDGDPDTVYFDSTSTSGFFSIPGLTEGNYNLSFSKSSENDCGDDGISGSDLYYISHHVTGNEPLNADQFIAADVSLDGSVSSYDASLIAQYSVGLIENFNDIPTHWIFKPKYELNVHSELLEQNGIYGIEYKPLVLDDATRTISAYRLGDVTGNYCHDPSLTSNRSQVQFTDITIDYSPIIILPIIISETTFIEGMDIEIGYDEDIFNPLSISLNNSNEVVENYQTVSNLLNKDKTIKTVTWAIEEPHMVEGKIGEVSFNWNNKNKSGKIWLKEFKVNDEPAVGGISLIGLSGNDVVDGVNIINGLVPVQLSLHQNYPNPFNPQTTIKWSMPLSGVVSLEVYNLQGQLVALLFNGQLEAGIHEQIWDATAYPSGIYFYRMTTNKKTLQKVMLLLK